jgi:hypothetical protein
MSSDTSRPSQELRIFDSAARPRRSTLETFNDELAVLDRPIEGDVEYCDEVPPTRWLRLRTVVAALFVVAGGGFLALSGLRPGELAPTSSAQVVAPAKVPVESVAAAASAPAFTPRAPSAPAIASSGKPAMPLAKAPTATQAERSAQSDEAPTYTSPASRAVWAKKLHLAGQPKHGRSAGNRSSRRSDRR